MVSARFRLPENAKVLHLPIHDTDPYNDSMWYVTVTAVAGDTRRYIGEFYCGVTADTPDYWCPMDLSYHAECDFELSCDDADAPADLFSKVEAGGSVFDRADLYPDFYREPQRQQIHFTPVRGWINDPNGLVTVDGVYHICYQHNPFGRQHGAINISWGMATSEDGVHFKQYPDAIMPRDALTHIASGSALIDKDDLSGFGKRTVIAAYTALQSHQNKGRKHIGTRGQMLEYSTDGGFTFTPFEENPIIPVAAGEWWRDPKLIRMDDGTLCIAVYETFEGKNCVSFYSSRDCRRWRFESRSFDLFECPDLFRLTVSETGERLWVLYGAESVYRVGHFENYRFTAIEGGEYLDYGEDTYAGQTFNDGPDETERMHLSYLRDHEMAVGDHHDCGFSQSLSVMCRFTLHKTAAGYRLYRTPIEALDTLCRVEEARDYHLSLTAAPQEGLRVTQTVRLPLPTPSDCVLTLTGKEEVSMNIMGKGLVYHPATHTFEFAGGKHYTLTRPENLAGDSVTVRILTDRRSVEYFIGDEISATYSIGTEQKELLLDGSDTTVDCRLYPCKPIF